MKHVIFLFVVLFGTICETFGDELAPSRSIVIESPKNTEVVLGPVMAPQSTSHWVERVRARVQSALNLDTTNLENQIQAAAHRIGTLLSPNPDGGARAKEFGLHNLATAEALQGQTLLDLGKTYRSLRKNVVGAGSPPLMNQSEIQRELNELRRLIRRLTGLKTLRSPNSTTELEAASQAIAATLAQPSSLSDRAVEQDFRNAYAKLAEVDVLEEELREVRSGISSPNVVLNVKTQFFDVFTKKPITQPINVDESQEGTRVIGRGQMVAHVSVQAIPSEGKGRLNLHVQGMGNTNVTAINKIATVRAVAKTPISVDQTLFVTTTGVDYGSRCVRACTESTLSGICVNIKRPVLRKLFTPIAKKVAEKKLEESDPQSAAKAKKEIEEQVAKQLGPAVTRANDMLQRTVWLPLASKDIEPGVSVRSTSESLDWNATQTTPWRLGAMKPSPNIPNQNSDIVVRLHESAIRNVNLFGAGLAIDEQVLRELIYDQLGLTSDSADEEPSARIASTLRLAEDDPLEVVMEDGAAVMRIRVSQVDRGGEEMIGAGVLELGYRPEKTSQGIVLKRTGPIQYTPAGDKTPIPLGENVLSLLDRFFANEFRTVPSNSDSTKVALRAVEIVIDEGWLLVGLGQEITSLVP